MAVPEAHCTAVSTSLLFFIELSLFFGNIAFSAVKYLHISLIVITFAMDSETSKQNA